MLELVSDKTPLEVATFAQRLAADPSGTRLAAANAGSGKTRVLVNRVSRILLGGTEPEDILCLTYTKAAASEMQERLFTTLGRWSVLYEDPLRDDLTELFGQSPDTLKPPVSLPEARKLFAKALETPEGLKVQTIHAFCERILSRFPIEAGILPGFEPLDETEMAELRAEVETQILKEAMQHPDGIISKALRVLTLERADKSLEELFKWMGNNPHKIESWNAQGLEPLAKSLKLGDIRDEVTIAETLWSRLNLLQMQLVMAALKKGGANDVKKGLAIEQALNASNVVNAVKLLGGMFYKQDNKPLGKFYAIKTADVAKDWIDTYSSDIMEAKEALEALHVFTLTESVFNLASRFAELYRDAKHKARGLDYSDQILFVRRLLQNSEAADWVRYKLDGGIKHILLDEAQDTSPEQWEIVNILAKPFFEPSPDDDLSKPRTLFAVGDEKQSIYGFQGAKPERFLDEIRHHSAHATTDIRMNMSFRSTQHVLDLVDSVLFECGGMQQMFDPEKFPPASDERRHVAHRKDQGLVELWPITPPPEKVEDREPWDTRPVDGKNKSHQIEVLATKIAVTIKAWIDTGKPIFDRELNERGATRPIQPKDILILVRRRGDLFDAVIRQLKGHEIPIAGADRLKLSDALVVKDLIALSRFCLLPSDDLSLAETLKSPFFGFDDDGLMRIALDRSGRLFEALAERDPSTYNILSHFIALSKELTPYDFYARILDYKDASGLAMRERIYSRLSMEARDALEAFLHQALDHQTRMAPNLQTFLHLFSKGEVVIKREQDTGVSEVRVMTVHGAKGLESPVVILPDTTNVPPLKEILLPDTDNGFIWNKTKISCVEPAKTAAQARASQEQLRLLYVAMTRAESHLIICGAHIGKPNQKLKAGCWYDWMKKGMEALGAEAFEAPFQREVNGELVTGLRYGGLPDPYSDGLQLSVSEKLDLPDWINEAAPAENTRRRVTPSHLLSQPSVEMAVRSPATSKDPNFFLRGNLTHKLLEILPEVSPDLRRHTAATILSGYDNLTPKFTQQIMDEVFAVIEHPDFAHIFAPGTRAEVSLAGSAKTLPDGLYLNAQIDRLCVTETDVTIVDYKSNRPPPRNAADVSDLYLGQMAAYRELAREIYPNHRIRCALLWTDGPYLMMLPDTLLDVALQKVAALPIS